MDQNEFFPKGSAVFQLTKREKIKLLLNRDLLFLLYFILYLIKNLLKKFMSTNKKIDFRDLLASFFRVFTVIVRIQSFIKNDQPFAVTLVWAFKKKLVKFIFSNRC